MAERDRPRLTGGCYETEVSASMPPLSWRIDRRSAGRGDAILTGELSTVAILAAGEPPQAIDANSDTTLTLLFFKDLGTLLGEVFPIARPWHRDCFSTRTTRRAATVRAQRDAGDSVVSA